MSGAYTTGGQRATYASIAAAELRADSQSYYPDDDDAYPTYPRSPQIHPYFDGAMSRGQGKPGILKSQADHAEDTYGGTGYVMPRPSYLRMSRYFQKLDAQDRRMQKEAHEEILAYEQRKCKSALGSRQSSSTNLTLTKTSGSAVPARGIAQDLHERVLSHSPSESDLRPLPSKWNEYDKCNGLDVSNHGLEVKFQGVARSADDAAAVRADHPMPRDCGLYYFEVTVMSRGRDGLIGVGFSSSRPSLTRLPGWEQESWGYHGDDGNSFSCSHSGKAYGPKFSALDVVGCGVNFRTNSAFFTKNGIFLGDAFHNVKVDKLYPCVGIKKPGEHVKVNFGQTPFVFDIDTMMMRERQIVQRDVMKFKLAENPLLGTADETHTIHELISQYLAHEGYIESANAFSAEVKSQYSPLDVKGTWPKELSEPEDFNASQRHRIRSAILAGDVEQAFEHLETHFPGVLCLDSNRDVYFRLRCRSFIEMILRSYETTKPSHSTANGSSNGFNGASAMDVDDEDGNGPMIKHKQDKTWREQEDSEMNDFMNDVITCGMQLRADFEGDPRKEVKKALSDTLALLAYPDARDSSLGELVEGKGRMEIAEEVNGVILVSLGKPRSALLERLCAQTEVLLDALAEDGGAGAFASVRQVCFS